MESFSKCSVCGRLIAVTAPRCPGCGATGAEARARKKTTPWPRHATLYGVGAAFFAFFAFFLLSNHPTTAPAPAVPASVAPASVAPGGHEIVPPLAADIKLDRLCRALGNRTPHFATARSEGMPRDDAQKAAFFDPHAGLLGVAPRIWSRRSDIPPQELAWWRNLTDQIVNDIYAHQNLPARTSRSEKKGSA